MLYAPGRLLSPIAGGVPPSLDLNFLGGAADTLDSRITFSRAGMAWQYDSTGTLVTAPHNLLTESQSFDAAGWTKNNCTVTGNAAVSPAGATTADLVTGTTTTVSITQSATISSGARVVVSVSVKAGAASWARLRVQGSAEVASQWYNLSTGAIGTTTSTANIIISSPTATDAGSGWWRVSAVFATTGFTTLAVGAGPAASNGASGVLNDSIYLWGAQLEQHTTARPYLNTTVRNLIGFSEQFDNAAWTKTRATVTANAVAGPSPLDSGTSADKVVEATDVATTRNLQQAVSVISGVTYALSVYAKSAERAAINLRFGSGFAAGNVTFDLSGGTLTSGGSVASSSITAIGSGWYRCFCAFVATSSTSAGAQVFLHNGSSITYDGVAGNGVYLFGAQVSSAGSLTTYVPTVAAAPTSAAYYGPRFDYDPVALLARGLLIEEARTNLFAGDLTNTTNWPAVGSVTRASGTLAPDGTTNGVTLTEPAGGTVSYGVSSASVTITASTATTCSVFAKAGTGSILRVILGDNTTTTISAQAYFNLGTGVVGTTGTQASGGGTPTSISATITAVGNSWYRCTVTATLATAITGVMLLRMTSADNVTSDTGSKTMSFWAPQIEVGAFATSPIVSTTAAITRAVDAAVIQPLGSWFSATAGTLAVDAALIGSVVSKNILSVSDNTANELYQINTTAGGVVQFAVTDGGVAQVAASSSVTSVAGTTFRVAGAYAANDFAVACNGGSVTTDSSGTLPTVDRIYLAASGTGASPASLYLRRLRVYDRRLPNATLQVIAS